MIFYLYFCHTQLNKQTFMKKLLTITAIFCFISAAQGQSFSFQLFFSDAQGNKDTIILGTDDLATDTIDTALGEVNIIGVPIDTGLDIRITDEWLNRNWYQIPGTYHTKKQLIGNCTNPILYYPIQCIDIHTKHWPVTMTWDSSLFKDVCNNGSLVTVSIPEVGGIRVVKVTLVVNFYPKTIQ